MDRPCLAAPPSVSLTGLLPWLERFEQAWQNEIAPDISLFHAEAGSAFPDPGLRGHLLLELIKIDLEYRWRPEVAQKFHAAPANPRALPVRPRVEDYLALFPELNTEEGGRIDLLLEEYRVRRRWGNQPTREEYQGRFADLGDRLVEALRQLSEQLQMETAPPGPVTPTDPDATVVYTLPSSPPSRPAIPGYEILSELGRGGMGVVYQARHLPFQRTVALKTIRSGAYASEEQRSRFLTEAQAVARLQHPSIVQIHEIGEHQGLLYFSLEYVDGGTLSGHLKKSPPSDQEAARLMEILSRAVHYAHGRGIIHRDLKPANILLTSDGVPKIADFGLARVVSDDQSATQSGLVVGTPSYMAPEQALGRSRDIGPATDVYALGVILYELLTGQPPFRGDTPMDTLRQVIDQPPQPPHVHNPRVDRALQAICLKCLEKSAKDRYPSADALADDLAAFLRGEAVQAQSGTAFRLLGAVFRESRYTEIMRLWSGIWMGLAVNVFWSSLAVLVLLLNEVHEYGPYAVIWTVKMLLDLLLAYFLRIRTGPPIVPIERQLVQILVFFWAGHFLSAWFFLRSGANVVQFLPFIDLEVALVLATMAAILGGSFYVTAGLCTLMAILDALWPGAGKVLSMTVVCPTFFWLGWKQRRHRGAK